jgi:hypothetical protein
LGVAPELLYLTAKLAALMPFGRVAALLGEVLPLSTTIHANTSETARYASGNDCCAPKPHYPSADTLR